MVHSALIVTEVPVKIEDVRVMVAGVSYWVDGECRAYAVDRDDFTQFEIDDIEIHTMMQGSNLNEIRFDTLPVADQTVVLDQVKMVMSRDEGGFIADLIEQDLRG